MRIREILIRLICLPVMTAAISGCLGTGTSTLRSDMSAAAEGGSITEVVRLAEEYLSSEEQTSSFLIFTSECCVKAGDTEKAEEYAVRACGIEASEKTFLNYLTVLAEGGKLDALRESFPAAEDITLKGKPLSEYDREALYEAAGIEMNGNRADKTVKSYEYSDGKKYCETAVLPYGLSEESSFCELLTAVGFTEEQAGVLKNCVHITVRLRSSGGGEVSAKMNEYAPFSQHPMENNNTLTLRVDYTELEFICRDDVLRGYTVTKIFN